MKFFKQIDDLITSFSKLPGVGPKSAQRLAFYIIKEDKNFAEEFSKSLLSAKTDITLCKKCFNFCSLALNETECSICQDENRDLSKICIVESIQNLIAIENANYNGLYHVLHGVLNPLHGVGVDDIKIKELLERIKDNKDLEVIFATNPTMEGEATAMYLKKSINELDNNITFSRISRGIPTGGDIEYADKTTILNALGNRQSF